MMADTGTGRISATKVISQTQRYNRDTRSLQKDVGHLSCERTSSAGQGVCEKGRDEQESAQPKTIIVMEQWICLVLGLVCIVFGIYILDMPTFRVTAVACIGLGVALARRGWAHL